MKKHTHNTEIELTAESLSAVSGGSYEVLTNEEPAPDYVTPDCEPLLRSTEGDYVVMNTREDPNGIRNFVAATKAVLNFLYEFLSLEG